MFFRCKQSKCVEKRGNPTYTQKAQKAKNQKNKQGRKPKQLPKTYTTQLQRQQTTILHYKTQNQVELYPRANRHLSAWSSRATYDLSSWTCHTWKCHGPRNSKERTKRFINLWFSYTRVCGQHSLLHPKRASISKISTIYRSWSIDKIIPHTSNVKEQTSVGTHGYHIILLRTAQTPAPFNNP